MWRTRWFLGGSANEGKTEERESSASNASFLYLSEDVHGASFPCPMPPRPVQAHTAHTQEQDHHQQQQQQQ